MKRKFKIVDGCLIELALAGSFDVIAHGCNCFNAQLNGLAPQMVDTFDIDRFRLEDEYYKGDIGKLGNIDFYMEWVSPGFNNQVSNMPTNYPKEFPLYVVNAYTQFLPGPNADIHAVILCLKKINYVFKGRRVGLPKIGCGIGGLDWEIVSKAYELYLPDVELTVVNYKPKEL
jgi:O-acetyl-ADP-ribose deacetylase (regulator of RNase III)